MNFKVPESQSVLETLQAVERTGFELLFLIGERLNFTASKYSQTFKKDERGNLFDNVLLNYLLNKGILNGGLKKSSCENICAETGHIAIKTKNVPKIFSLC